VTVERKPFLLRLDPVAMAALRAWASDDLRSLNGQIEYLLRRALRDAGRLPAPKPGGEATGRATQEVDRARNRALNDHDAAAVPAMPMRRARR
jgi:hypothetical protein